MNHEKDWFQISWLDLRVGGLEQEGSEVDFRNVNQALFQELWKVVWSESLQVPLLEFLPELRLSVVINKTSGNRWDFQR